MSTHMRHLKPSSAQDGSKTASLINDQSVTLTTNPI